MGYLIKNIDILTMNDTLETWPRGGILVEGEQISFVGDAGEAERAAKAAGEGIEAIDGRGAIALPAFINAHTHSGMIPFRSLGDDYPDRLRRFLMPLEKRAMTRELAVKSARYACAEMLLAGTGCFVDMYFFEDAIADAVKESGMRAFLGETVMADATCDSPEPSGGLALGEAFIRNWQGDDRITPLIAPHAVNTNSAETIRKAAEIAERYNVPITMHVSEMEYEMAYCRDRYSLSPIAFLESLGAFSPKFIAAHCILAGDEDIEILARNRVSVAHCIGANTKSAKGVAPVKHMLDAGIPLALGTDGPASGNTLDMFTLFGLFAKFHKTMNRDRTLFPAPEIVKLATSNAARALGIYNETGSLEAGKKADITLVETESVNMFPNFDPYSVLVYSANAANVDTVLVNGRILVRGKRLTGLSLSELRQDIDEAMGFFKTVCHSI